METDETKQHRAAAVHCWVDIAHNLPNVFTKCYLCVGNWSSFSLSKIFWAISWGYSHLQRLDLHRTDEDTGMSSKAGCCRSSAIMRSGHVHYSRTFRSFGLFIGYLSFFTPWGYLSTPARTIPLATLWVCGVVCLIRMSLFMMSSLSPYSNVFTLRSARPLDSCSSPIDSDSIQLSAQSFDVRLPRLALRPRH